MGNRNCQVRFAIPAVAMEEEPTVRVARISDGCFVCLVHTVDLRVERLKRPVLKRVKVGEFAQVFDQAGLSAFDCAFAWKDASEIGMSDRYIDAKDPGVLANRALNCFAIGPGIDRVYIDWDRDLPNHVADASHCFRLRGQFRRDRRLPSFPEYD